MVFEEKHHMLWAQEAYEAYEEQKLIFRKDGGGFHDYGYSARWARTNPVFTKTSNGRNAIGSV